MSKLVHLILVIWLVSQCQSFCGEDDDPTSAPKVTVANSTHLKVSWHGLFAGCYSQVIKNMVVVAEHIAQNTAMDKTKAVNFEERNATLQVDPCMQYRIYLRLFSYGNSYRDSKIVKYNDITSLNVASLYAGLLQDEKFMQNVCLKKEKVITFPDPPEAVSKCILTKGDQDNDEFTAVGQSNFVPLEILNPMSKEPLTITANVNKIEKCVPTTTTTATSPSDFFPKLGGPQSVIIFTTSILGTILVVALITTMVCWFKNRKRSVVTQQEKDFNPMYGTVYYHLDRAVVTDENGYYGGGNIEKEGGDQERITDNNSEYSRE